MGKETRPFSGDKGTDIIRGVLSSRSLERIMDNVAGNFLPVQQPAVAGADIEQLTDGATTTQPSYVFKGRVDPPSSMHMG